ncbi:MAG TPA: SelB C-terminal domain-containing protein [Streptosporangiaceae bacterium]
MSGDFVSHVIAAVGQGGHGKTALIHALTGTVPDEQVPDGRGATIGQGSGSLTLPSGTRLAVADVAGPARVISTLMAGTGVVPAVIFVVAADEGWMPQSAEHAALVSALDIRHGLLVVTKSDRADPAPVLAEASARLGETTLGDVRAVTVSCVTRAGFPDLVTALDDLCARLPGPDPGAAVRVWIDGAAADADGGSTVVTGTLPAGTVHTHDELLVTPSMRPVRIRELISPGDRLEAVAGAAHVVMAVRGAGEDVLHRGMALVQPGRWTLTDVIDVRVGAVRPASGAQTWVPGQREDAMPGQLARTVTLHIGSARVPARVRPLGSGVARLTLAEPLPLHAGERVLLREYGGRRTGSGPAVAGSVVLDVAPPPLTRRGAAAAAARQLAAWPDRPTAAELLARHGLMRASVLLAMGIPELPPPVAGEWLADSERWRALGHQLGEVLAGHAAVEPLAAGLPVEAARAALDLPDRRLVAALARPPFRISSGAVHIAPAVPQPNSTKPETTLPEAALAAVRVLRADLQIAPFMSPDANRLRKLGLDAAAIAAAVSAGELIRIGEHVVLAPGADLAAAQILAGLEQPFTAAQARQALGTTRRTVIPLLEFLDVAGLTERLADDRRMVRAADRAAVSKDGEEPSLVAGEPGR